MQVQDDKPYDEINITPMLDLAYVLLVIFILMTTSTVQGIKASIPRGSNVPAKKKQDDDSKMKVVEVDPTGTLVLISGKNRESVTPAILDVRLKQAMDVNPEVAVIVKGAGGVKYENVTEIVGIAVKLGIKKVGLATSARQ